MFTLKGFLLNVPLKATKRLAKFWFWLRGLQFDSAVWCTPRSLTPRNDAHREKYGSLDSAVWCTPLLQKCPFECSNSLRLSIIFNRKTSKVKKIPWTICQLQYHYRNNILSFHREIIIVKIRIKTDTLRYNAHSGAWLCGGLHTVESDSAVVCTPQSFYILSLHVSAVWLCGMRHTQQWDAHRGAF